MKAFSLLASEDMIADLGIVLFIAALISAPKNL